VSSDLQAATLNACQMIGQLGMGTTLISSAAMEYPAGGIVSKVLGNDEGRAEVEALLTSSKDSVTQMLDEHRNVVEALRDALLEREELIGDDILSVIRESQPSGAGDADGGAGGEGVGSLLTAHRRISLDRTSPAD
jgi:ATP-dependent Zn protease